MSLDSESFTPEGAENFVAPDESKRVQDPAVAESMARQSDHMRTEAAQSRQEASHWRAEAKVVDSEGSKSALESTAGMWEEDAKFSDIIADGIERAHDSSDPVADNHSPEGAENNIAPDESQRIHNAETAETMARASDNARSRAAETRREASDTRKGKYNTHMMDGFTTSEVEAMNEKSANILDRHAEIADELGHWQEEHSQSEHEPKV